MVAYPVFHPQSMLSATFVMVLGSLLLVFGLIEILVDTLDRERPTPPDPEAISRSEEHSSESCQVIESQNVGTESPIGK